MLAHDPIRDFILEHYKTCTTVGSVNFRYLVMVAKEQECPTPEAERLEMGERHQTTLARGGGMR
jgi:hypothetical protein